MNKNYKLIKEEYIQSINSNSILLEHIKSGARVLLLTNDDENKVFQIGFRTPPTDDTGVPHILEHSTLCGSKKFPVKEPFVELLKGSLNTFLNAMTFGDKTIYPVASCNDKDFANLMEVYLDAVFYPNVYAHEEIFKQEGWHYELDSLDGDIIYNGVVYNEMKGAFSSPDQVVMRASQNSLFPDNAYGVESGGDPEFIPNLTYEQFKAFHSKYYHPSNSYITLYGNFNVEERLDYMDKEYLSKFDKIKVDSEIPFQKPFKAHKEVEIEYPVGKDESLEDKTFYSFNVAIGKYEDVELSYAMDILTHILINMPGAKLKQALLDANIAKDISGMYDSGVLQPVFSVLASNAKSGKLDVFKKVIKDTLTSVCKEGIDAKTLEAAINFFEFRSREGDFGGLPKGLLYAINTYATWLYNDNMPTEALNFDKYFKSLREKINTSYYTDLIKKYLLDNNHVSFVTCSPSQTLNEKRENALKEKLAKYKKSLTKEELEKLIEDTKALKLYQATPNTKEELDTIPLLAKSDIKENLPKIENELITVDGVKVLKHKYATNGVNYFKFAFDSSSVGNDELPYLGLLSDVLGFVDTKNYKYQELAVEVMINSGGMTQSSSSYLNNKKLVSYYEFNIKVLPEKVKFAFDIVKEIITTSNFNDKKHLYELIARIKSSAQMSTLGRGHLKAASHAKSYYDIQAKYDDTVNGIGYFKFLEEIEANFDKYYDIIVSKLTDVMKKVFRKENLLISYTSLDDSYKPFVLDFSKALFTDEVKKDEFKFEPYQANEGFKTSSQVQFCGLAGNYSKVGKFNAGMRVLGMALNYDYLWNKVRVLGGAYGFLLRFSREGDILLGSYRDPNLENTYEVFKGIPEYIRGMNQSNEELLKCIIGAVGDVTSPLTPSQKGERAYSTYVKGLSEDCYHKEFEEILNVKREDFIKYADLFEEAIKQNNICTIGNENKIEEAKGLFKEVKNLIK